MDEKNQIRLSPIVRLKMTFDAELGLDKAGIFGLETYNKYLEMHQKVEAKQDQMIRSLVVTDALLFLMISGQNWTIPGIGVEVSSIPAIQEILLFTSALSFFFLCVVFITNQCYSGIIDQFGNRIANSDLMDPDFFTASRKYFEFWIKLFSPKLNTWGQDFYQHNRSFSIFCWCVNALIIITVLTIPTAHLALMWVASLNILASDLNVYGKYFLLGAVAIVNLGGLVMVIGMSKDFTFNMIEPTEETSSGENNNEHGQ